MRWVGVLATLAVLAAGCSSPARRVATRQSPLLASLPASASPSPTPEPSPPPTQTASPAPSPSPRPLATSPKAAASPAPPAPASPAPKPAAAPAPGGLAGRVVLVDPGHNGQDYAHPAETNQQVFIGNGSKACDATGTAAHDGYTEAAYNFDLASRLAALLSAAGARVVMTRTDNNGWGPCITQRAAMGNNAHADVAISIHADGSPSGRGFHVILPAPVAGYNDGIVVPSQRLGLDIRDAYAKGTGMPYSSYVGVNALIQRSDLGGLNLSKVPKVFIETGNMANPSDIALLESPAWRDQAAQSLKDGLAAFLAGR